MTRVLRLAVKSLLVLVLLAVAAVVALSLRASQKKRAAVRGWAESFEPMEALVARYPSTPNSSAAQELAALSAPLGISLDVPPAEGTPQDRTHAARARLRLVQEEANRFRPLVAFLAAEGSKANDERVDAPPAPVAEFLSGHRTEIEAIEGNLLEKDAPSWACDIQKGADAPLPPLLGHRDLTNVLLVHGLESAHAGNDQAAHRALEASWKLNLGLRERPELISQLMAVSAAGSQSAVLRRIPAPLGEWQERLKTRDWRRSMLRSFQAEAWMFERGLQVEPSSMNAGGALRTGFFGGLGRIPGPLTKLWLELSLADYSDQMRRMAVDLRDQDPCAVDMGQFTRRLEAEIPWWNVLSKIAMPNLARSWGNVGRALLDDELTGLVLRARTQMRSDPKAAPQTATIPSSVCVGMSWMIKPQVNGDLEVGADRNPFKDPKSAPPLGFRVHRAQSTTKVGRLPSGTAGGTPWRSSP